MKWLFALFLKIFAGKAFEWLGSFVGQQESKKAAAEAAVAKAERETLVEIGETADAQSQVNAADRGSATDVARRLRERIAKRQARSVRPERNDPS